MSIKNIFKSKKKINEKKVLKISGHEYDLSDVPEVLFEDFDLQLMIGQWLGITKKNDEIASIFGLFLKLVGVQNSEICILNQYDKANFSFNCHFSKNGDDAKISLRYRAFTDSPAVFNIDYQNENRDYVYDNLFYNKLIKFNLQNYTIKNPENGNSCYRFLSPFKAHFTLTNGDDELFIVIDKPESMEFDAVDDSNYVFRLENEEQLLQYLLGLKFPIKINELYSKICEISINRVEKYPKFGIEVNKKIDEKNSKTTDLIELKHGKINQFMITKNGKFISIDNEGNWSYNSSKFIISQNNTGNINYCFNSVFKDELLNSSILSEEYDNASQDVENVKKLAKNLFK